MAKILTHPIRHLLLFFSLARLTTIMAAFRQLIKARRKIFQIAQFPCNDFDHSSKTANQQLNYILVKF
jgi:glutathione peroxidase-family protein